jgi:SNF2 family DNA or RNA helicase
MSKLSFVNQQFLFDGKPQELSRAVELKEFADESAKKILNRILVKRYKFDDWVLPEYLDAHQRAGVSWIMTRSRSYLAHAPGAGKTCEAITASCLTPGEGSVLFVVPPTATANWAREIDLWAHQMKGTRGWEAKSSLKRNTRIMLTGTVIL